MGLIFSLEEIVYGILGVGMEKSDVVFGFGMFEIV